VETYQIAILVNREFFHVFEYYDPGRKVSLGGKTRIITLELAKLDEVIGKSSEAMSRRERWGCFFRYLMDKSQREKINEIVEREEGIAMASEVLMSITRDDVERARLMSEYKYIVEDTQSQIVDAEREGEARGITIGEVRGEAHIIER
jgi:hypothetical protein